jgi:hypothetical protein
LCGGRQPKALLIFGFVILGLNRQFINFVYKLETFFFKVLSINKIFFNLTKFFLLIAYDLIGIKIVEEIKIFKGYFHVIFK